ncbi:MAG: hypothetical protein ABIQ95_06220 [Bdellovibrionia bacterium]
MTQAKVRSHKLPRFSSLIGVFTFAAFTLSTASSASTGSSWIQRPLWAAEGTSAVHHSPKEAERISDISPFSPGSHNVGIDLGQVFLMGDLAKYSDCIGSQLHYTYGASDLFGLDTSIGYSEHSDGKYSVASLLTGMRVNMTWYDKVVPYALVGLGFYRPTYKDLSSAVGATGAAPLADLSSISAFLFGIHFGPGIDLQVSRNFYFGAALTIHDMFGTAKTYSNGAPLMVGGIYTSFFLHAGFTF